MKKIIFILIAVLLFSCKEKESDITFLSMEEYEKKYGKFSNGTISDGVPEGFAYSHDFGTGSADKAAWFVIEKAKLENDKYCHTLILTCPRGTIRLIAGEDVTIEYCNDNIIISKAERPAVTSELSGTTKIEKIKSGTEPGDDNDLRGQGGVLINSTKTKQ